MLVSDVNISESIKFLCTIERDVMTTRMRLRVIVVHKYKVANNILASRIITLVAVYIAVGQHFLEGSAKIEYIADDWLIVSAL